MWCKGSNVRTGIGSEAPRLIRPTVLRMRAATSVLGSGVREYSQGKGLSAI